MCASNFQGIFSKRVESQIKNYTTKNQPISDIKKYINQISMMDNLEIKTATPKTKNQSKFQINKKQIIKKKTLLDLIPNCDITKLLLPTQETNKIPIIKKYSNINNLTTNFTNLSKIDFESGRRQSVNLNSFEKGKIINQIADQISKFTTRSPKRKKSLVSNQIIHNLDVRKNISDISVVNDNKG